MSNPMTPLEAIKADQPNVWITYQDGFGPEEFAGLGYTFKKDRERFLERTKPGVLVVIVGGPKAPNGMQQRIIGIVQCSHQIGSLEKFSDPEAYAKKQADPNEKDRWNFAVRVTRAWTVNPETRPGIEEFANDSYWPQRGQHLGRAGDLLTFREAQKILNLSLMEVGVYGYNNLKYDEFLPGEDAVKPSQPGPVSQNSFLTSESEGPKQLYILKLTGVAGVFLNDSSARGIIIKVGFSGDPFERCKALNWPLPKSQFQWMISKSNELDMFDHFPSSSVAKVGEQAMISYLYERERSLGGEFFLIDEGSLEKAWGIGLNAAREAMTVE